MGGMQGSNNLGAALKTYPVMPAKFFVTNNINVVLIQLQKQQAPLGLLRQSHSCQACKLTDATAVPQDSMLVHCCNAELILCPNRGCNHSSEGHLTALIIPGVQG
jgi:hypothetical protein